MPALTQFKDLCWI